MPVYWTVPVLSAVDEISALTDLLVQERVARTRVEQAYRQLAGDYNRLAETLMEMQHRWVLDQSDPENRPLRSAVRQ